MCGSGQKMTYKSTVQLLTQLAYPHAVHHLNKGLFICRPCLTFAHLLKANPYIYYESF